MMILDDSRGRYLTNHIVRDHCITEHMSMELAVQREWYMNRISHVPNRNQEPRTA